MELPAFEGFLFCPNVSATVVFLLFTLRTVSVGTEPQTYNVLLNYVNSKHLSLKGVKWMLSITRHNHLSTFCFWLNIFYLLLTSRLFPGQCELQTLLALPGSF